MNLFPFLTEFTRLSFSVPVKPGCKLFRSRKNKDQTQEKIKYYNLLSDMIQLNFDNKFVFLPRTPTVSLKKCARKELRMAI